jgi:hypothetical protein
VVREHKNAVAKQQANAESAATDAKTARLKALRLAKEEADKQATDGAASSPKGE